MNMVKNMYKLKESTNYLLKLIKQKPDIAIVSGQNDLDIEKQMEKIVGINYSSIPWFQIYIRKNQGFTISESVQ